jgi:hypothetical protein
MGKKVFNIFIIFLVVITVFSSCITSIEDLGLGPEPEFDIQISSELGSNIADISIDPNWYFEYRAPLGRHYPQGVDGFDLTIKNNTEKIIYIVWELSSISYLGKSKTLFIDGQKYSNAEEPMSPTVIAANNEIQKRVYSSEQPYFMSMGSYSSWVTKAIDAPVFTLVLCIRSADIEEFYTIAVTKKQVL